MTQENTVETDEQDERGVKVMIVLYPRHIERLDAYAKREGRSRSNAIRRLIDTTTEQQAEA